MAGPFLVDASNCDEPGLLCYSSQEGKAAGDMKRILGRVLVGIIGVLSVLYVGDWAVWRARVAMGGGMGKVMVTSILVTQLKGNKEEYDWDGTANVDCSKSIFPQAGAGACWWLRRHNAIYER